MVGIRNIEVLEESSKLVKLLLVEGSCAVILVDEFALEVVEYVADLCLDKSFAYCRSECLWILCCIYERWCEWVGDAAEEDVAKFWVRCECALLALKDSLCYLVSLATLVGCCEGLEVVLEELWVAVAVLPALLKF